MMMGTPMVPSGAIQIRKASGLALIVLALTCAGNARQNPAAHPKPCSEPEQKQLEFWVGEWDLTWPGNTPGETAHGTNSIARILDGCVVEESFSGGDAMPLRGRSVSIFNAGAGKWKQTWVDNEGAYLDFVGEFKDGRMILAREATRPDGSKSLQRMVFKNITRDEFDWSWEGSKDGGKTWSVVWPIHYRRKP
ncbi:MAG: DUF1579 family protein [Terriglobales bacterium]